MSDQPNTTNASAATTGNARILTVNGMTFVARGKKCGTVRMRSFDGAMSPEFQWNSGGLIAPVGVDGKAFWPEWIQPFVISLSALLWTAPEAPRAPTDYDVRRAFDHGFGCGISTLPEENKQAACDKAWGKFSSTPTIHGAAPFSDFEHVDGRVESYDD